jgi:hypothetical protein
VNNQKKLEKKKKKAKVRAAKRKERKRNVEKPVKKQVFMTGLDNTSATDNHPSQKILKITPGPGSTSL